MNYNKQYNKIFIIIIIIHMLISCFVYLAVWYCTFFSIDFFLYKSFFFLSFWTRSHFINNIQHCYPYTFDYANSFSKYIWQSLFKNGRQKKKTLNALLIRRHLIFIIIYPTSRLYEGVLGCIRSYNKKKIAKNSYKSKFTKLTDPVK